MDLSPVQARRAVEDYLGYNATNRLMGRAFEIVSGWFRALGDWFGELATEHPLLGIAFMLGIVLVLALLIWHIVWTVRGVLRESSRMAAGDVAEEPEPDSLQHLARAGALAGGGQHVDAIRELFLAAVLHLDEAELAPYSRSDTNREYLRRLRRMHPQSEAPVARIAELVELHWYGMQPAGGDDYERARGAAEEVLGR